MRSPAPRASRGRGVGSGQPQSSPKGGEDAPQAGAGAARRRVTAPRSRSGTGSAESARAPRNASENSAKRHEQERQEVQATMVAAASLKEGKKLTPGFLTDPCPNGLTPEEAIGLALPAPFFERLTADLNDVRKRRCEQRSFRFFTRESESSTFDSVAAAGAVRGATAASVSPRRPAPEPLRKFVPAPAGSQVQTEEDLDLYCYCASPDDGREMILCDLCNEWFHTHCVQTRGESYPVEENEKFFCAGCIPAMVAHEANRREASRRETRSQSPGKSPSKQDWTTKSVYHQDFTVEEVKKCLAVSWKSSEANLPMRRVFGGNAREKILKHESVFPWAWVVSQERYREFHSCLDDIAPSNVLDYEVMLNGQVVRVWTRATSVSIDESMDPWKGYSPHHVFVKGKPHPNGMKSWIVVDHSGVILALVLFQRVDEHGEKIKKESTDSTVLRVFETIGKKYMNGCLAVGDKLFGSLKLGAKMLQQGNDVLFAVRKDRPSSILGKWLVPKLTNDGDHAVCIVFVKITDEDEDGGKDEAGNVKDDVCGVLDVRAERHGFKTVVREVVRDAHPPLEEQMTTAAGKNRAAPSPPKRARRSCQCKATCATGRCPCKFARHFCSDSCGCAGVRCSNRAPIESRVTRSVSQNLFKDVDHTHLALPFSGRDHDAAKKLEFIRDRARDVELMKQVRAGTVVPLGFLAQRHGSSDKDAKILCHMFSCFSTRQVERHSVQLESDGTPDLRQMRWVPHHDKQAEVAHKYNQLMDPPDMVDREIMALRTGFRHQSWVGQHIDYLIGAFAGSNARRYFMSGNAIPDKISSIVWRDEMFAAYVHPECKLTKLPVNYKDTQCRICRDNWQRHSVARFLCSRCLAICYHCAGRCVQAGTRARNIKCASYKGKCDGSVHIEYASRAVRPRARLSSSLRSAQRAVSHAAAEGAPTEPLTSNQRIVRDSDLEMSDPPLSLGRNDEL